MYGEWLIKVKKIMYGKNRSPNNTKRKEHFEIRLYLRLQLTNWSYSGVLYLLFDSFKALPTIGI